MCGVPFHAVEMYVNRLISKGYKVAICEQMTDPKESKGLVERDVIRVITPGTVIEESMLSERKTIIWRPYIYLKRIWAWPIAMYPPAGFMCWNSTGATGRVS